MLAVGCVSTGCVSTAQRALDPEASEKRYYLGADYFSKRMYRPALEELLKAIELNPQNFDAHYLLGLMHLQEASEGEAMFEQASCVVGDEARLERKEVDDRFRKAEVSFRKAVELKPDFSEAWNSIAVVSLYFQRWDDAITASERALSNAVYRQPWTAQGNLAWALYHRKEYLRASKELRTALYGNPAFCVGRYRLAKVYFDQGNLEGAAEELEKVTSDKACPIQEAYLLAGMTALRRVTAAPSPGTTATPPPSSASLRAAASDYFHRCQALAPKSCVARDCRIAE